MRSLTTFLFVALLLTGTAYTYAKPHQSVKADSSVKVDRNLSGFTSIKIAGPFEVHITQGAAESVKFEAEPEVINRIVAEVDGGVLKIHNKHDNWGWGFSSWYSDKGIWRHHKKIVVYVTAKELNAITVSGNAIFNEGVSAETLKILVTGSGSAVGKVDVKMLESHLSGSGEIKLSGNAENSKVLVRGSGNFVARNLVTVKSAVHVSGSGRAEINASDKVDAAVRGSGDVSYTGTAKIINSSKSGSGEIRRF